MLVRDRRPSTRPALRLKSSRRTGPSGMFSNLQSRTLRRVLPGSVSSFNMPSLSPLCHVRFQSNSLYLFLCAHQSLCLCVVLGRHGCSLACSQQSAAAVWSSRPLRTSPVILPLTLHFTLAHDKPQEECIRMSC
ncbi:hypothetical protein CC86DRAFT_65323 [Ophiobolus disseminans]|uniref:Uncharacterized protein n=1 Tax=Ophiobolus disseminans TaxID=1469910 RepID=A0A6A6ZR36_9PLEO|nr:hypothetical protein CC86DRAFT_65323 [Ophiobolus disseminans]